MENIILVGYASKHGMTAEIANKIGDILRQAGLQVDVQPVNRVKDLKKYTAAVLGSAVYIAAWRKEMVKFLRGKEKTLAGMPVWLFSSGPIGEGEPLELSQGWKYPEAQRALIERIKPKDIVIFHGAIDMKKMGMLEKWVLRRVKAPTGDFRNWSMISTWASKIAEALK